VRSVRTGSAILWSAVGAGAEIRSFIRGQV
jgi:hypothetical protein